MLILLFSSSSPYLLVRDYLPQGEASNLLAKGSSRNATNYIGEASTIKVAGSTSLLGVSASSSIKSPRVG